MAYDKVVDSQQLDADLISVANAIRTRGGTSAQLAFPADFVSAVQAIPAGGDTGTEIFSAGVFTGISGVTRLGAGTMVTTPNIVVYGTGNEYSAITTTDAIDITGYSRLIVNLSGVSWGLTSSTGYKPHISLCSSRPSSAPANADFPNLLLNVVPDGVYSSSNSAVITIFEQSLELNLTGLDADSVYLAARIAGCAALGNWGATLQISRIALYV